MRKFNPVVLSATVIFLFAGTMMLGNIPVGNFLSTDPDQNAPFPIQPTPLVSGGTSTVKSRHVYLQYLSSYNVTLGGTVNITGFVLRYNTETFLWESGADEELRVFADGVEDPTVHYATPGGNFTFTYTLPTGWTNLAPDHILRVDIPNTSLFGSTVYNDTQAFNVYTDSVIIPDSTVLAGHYLLGDSVILTGTLTSSQVPTHAITGQTVNVVIGSSSGSATTGYGGVFTYPWVISEENPSGSFSFGGVSNDYSGSFAPIQLDTLEENDVDIKITAPSFPATTYEQTPIDVSGRVVLASDGTTPLPNRRIQLQIYNTSAEGSTDTQGKFTIRITVPNGVTTRDLNITLLYADGLPSPVGKLFAQVLTVGSQFDPSNPANPLPYGLIIGIVLVVVAVIVVFILLRKGIIKLNRARPVYEVNQNTLTDRVNALAAMGRIQEAMAYMLVKYLDALRFRMQMTKKRGQTVRDIATEAVRRHLHQAEILYPWTAFVEAAVYSGRPVTITDLEKTKAFFNTAQQLVPFSEQELTSQKPSAEPEESPAHAATKALAPKTPVKGSETHDAPK